METWEWLAGIMRELGSLLSPAACLHSFQPATQAPPGSGYFGGLSPIPFPGCEGSGGKRGRCGWELLMIAWSVLAQSAWVGLRLPNLWFLFSSIKWGQCWYLVRLTLGGCEGEMCLFSPLICCVGLEHHLAQSTCSINLCWWIRGREGKVISIYY